MISRPHLSLPAHSISANDRAHVALAEDPIGSHADQAEDTFQLSFHLYAL